MPGDRLRKRITRQTKQTRSVTRAENEILIEMNPREEVTYEEEKNEKEGTYEEEKNEKEGMYEEEKNEKEGTYEEEKSETEETYEEEKSETEVTHEEEKSDTDATYEEEKSDTDATYEEEKSDTDATYEEEKSDTDATYEAEKSDTDATYEEEKSETEENETTEVEVKPQKVKKFKKKKSTRQLPVEPVVSAEYQEQYQMLEREKHRLELKLCDVRQQIISVKKEVFSAEIEAVDIKLAMIRDGTDADLIALESELEKQRDARIQVAEAMRKAQLNTIKEYFDVEKLSILHSLQDEKELRHDQAVSRVEQEIEMLQKKRKREEERRAVRQEIRNRRNETRARTRPVRVRGPVVIYQCTEEEIIEDWNIIKTQCLDK